MTDDAPAATASAPAIDSIRDPRARRVQDVLKSSAPRPRTLIIDDEDSILQAVHDGVVVEELYVTPQRQDFATTIAQESGATTIVTVSDAVARDIFKTDKHPRVFALARAPRLPRLSDLSAPTGDLVVLDGVRITGNIGAVIRSARAFGASGVVLVDSALRSPLDRRIVRSSRGLIFGIPVVLAEHEELLAFLTKESIDLAGLEAGANAELPAIGDVPGRVALVLGSERRGPSAVLSDLAPLRYSIAMTPGVESLNVSVAAGIALYERSR